MSEKARERSRLDKKKPGFVRHESYVRAKLKKNTWRKPKGDKNSQRKCFRGRAANVSIGFGSAKSVRGLNKFGMKEVLIHNTSELEGLDPKANSAVISATVGKRKRMEILKAAGEKNIRVENRPRV